MKDNNPNTTFKQKNESKEGIVHSSYGDIAIDLTNGKVIDVRTEEVEWRQWVDTIDHFDLKEYRKFYKEHYNNDGEHAEFDILDIGFWQKGALQVYSPPSSAFRMIAKKDLAEEGI